MTDKAHLLSSDCQNFIPSPVREIFKRVDLKSIYSFAGGYPDDATFPLDTIKALCSKVIDKYGSLCFQYGSTQGVKALREALGKRYGVGLDNIQITTSSQQGIDVCCRVLLDPDDVALCLNPCYLGALQSMASYRAEVISFSELDPCCSVDADTICGVSIEKLQKAKLCYVIPDFQNPSGECLSLDQRKFLCSLAEKFDFMIVEDAPYRELRYSGAEIPSIYSLCPERTLHLGSFSKIFAPGFRLGWIFGPEWVLEQIFICKQALDLCPPILNQYLALEYLSSGELDRNLSKSIDLYRSKRDLMLELLDRYMPSEASWNCPDGGLFLFLTLPQSIDTVKLYDSALEAEVAYVAGSFFYSDGSHKNTMRLNFSFIDSSRMEKGIKILSDVIKKAL